MCIMKIHAAYFLMIVVALGIGIERTVSLRRASEEVTDIQAPVDVSEKGPDVPHLDARPTRYSLPEPAPEPVIEKPAPPVPVKVAVPAPQTPPKTATENMQDAARRYWAAQAQRFDRQQDRLSREEDPARRINLIRAMAGYVRVNTPSALDWAMGLENREERRAALEAINKKSLSGIGARIETDETGYPKIRDTTVLSAVGATGLVEPGDYIVGIERGDGQSVNFEGLPTKQVVQFLRGQPGTEVKLIMERAPVDGSTPYAFDVTIQRSLLVVQPPF